MEEIVFVTSNPGKVASAQRALNNDNLKLIWYEYDIIEPDVNDIEYIAKSKVLQGYEKVGKSCISLDSGFYVPNYPDCYNFPGAFPKRELLEKLGIEGFLDKMKDITDRYCYFKECLAYYDGENISYFYGISEGYLAYEREGLIANDKKWSDLWYIFIPLNCTKTLAGMTDGERETRPDNHTNAFQEFNNWYIKKRTKY